MDLCGFPKVPIDVALSVFKILNSSHGAYRQERFAEYEYSD